jgi:hypothetical protein
MLKLKKIIQLKKTIYNTWGVSIYNLAKLGKNNLLFDKSLEVLNKAVELGSGS